MRQSHKMVKHTFADKLFECRWFFYGVGAESVKELVSLLYFVGLVMQNFIGIWRALVVKLKKMYPR